MVNSKSRSLSLKLALFMVLVSLATVLIACSKDGNKGNSSSEIWIEVIGGVYESKLGASTKDALHMEVHGDEKYYVEELGGIDVSWSSSDNSIAQIYSNSHDWTGIIYAYKKTGKVTITATSYVDRSVKASIEVTIVE